MNSFSLRSSSLFCWSSLSLESPLWCHCDPEHSDRHPGFEHQFWSYAAPHIHNRQHVHENLLHPHRLLSLSFSLFPHRELVRFVELYCCCIVNRFELMEIPLVHIKLPIPYNWFFPISNLIKPTVPPHRLFAGENVKKCWDTARSKERKVRPDDFCFLQSIDSLTMHE